MDCLILTEMRSFELSLISKIFSNFGYFYQKGESNWGGLLMLFRPSLAVVTVKCETPSVCIVDVKLEQATRLIAVYAPNNKTWK